MLGLKRGTVELVSHQEVWHEKAVMAIDVLKTVLGDTAIDIQHVGSTAICGIHAKPIIDIVVGVKDLGDIKLFVEELAQEGIVFRKEDIAEQLLFVIGDFEKNFRTHHIHVVQYGSEAWHNYINFRDYLNAFPEKAADYDALKRHLAVEYANDRGSYTSGKQELITHLLEEARHLRGQS